MIAAVLPLRLSYRRIIVVFFWVFHGPLCNETTMVERDAKSTDIDVTNHVAILQKPVEECFSISPVRPASGVSIEAPDWRTGAIAANWYVAFLDVVPVRGCIVWLGRWVDLGLPTFWVRRVGATFANIPISTRSFQNCHRLSRVFHCEPKFLDWDFSMIEPISFKRVTDILHFYGQEWQQFCLDSLSIYLNCSLRSFVSLPSLAQRQYQKDGPHTNKDSRYPSGLHHALSGFVHRLRSDIHALLRF